MFSVIDSYAEEFEIGYVKELNPQLVTGILEELEHREPEIYGGGKSLESVKSGLESWSCRELREHLTDLQRQHENGETYEEENTYDYET